MKPGSPPTPPDDEALDPLLATLRQRLGDYGQAPPPAAWAAIRQRVAAPPQPWWRRPRCLLSLVALLGLVLVGGLAARYGLLFDNQLALHQKANSALTKNKLLATTKQATTTPSYPTSAGTDHPLAAAPPTTTGAMAHPPAPLAQRRAPGALATRKTKQLDEQTSVVPVGAEVREVPQRQAAVTASASGRRLAPASPRGSSRLRRTTTEAGNYAISHPLAATRRATALLADVRSARRNRRTVARTPVAAGYAVASQLAAGTPTTLKTRLHPVAAMPTRPTSARRSRRAAHRLGQRAGLPGPVAAAPATEAATLAGASANQAAGPLGLPLLGERGAAIDLLALKQPGLLLPELARPIIAAARPDSTPPAHAGRRWSLLLLAGPTLGYRTLGPAPTLAAGRPDFARLERPTLGLGAQVQGRRVLSGRWAVAAGVGYHEYATQLALSVKDSNTYTSVRQRDTYRLLTLPVQFTYALGAPRGRLAVGLLLGTELGWYVGGRSTEGSDCGCQQRAYPTDSTHTSPYRPLSLAFSLGLDLRYRLGGPASRWHLVVQPTGRYVATPFVRSDAVGFTRRQPFSLGLLTGFSWDLR